MNRRLLAPLALVLLVPACGGSATRAVTTPTPVATTASPTTPSPTTPSPAPATTKPAPSPTASPTPKATRTRAATAAPTTAAPAPAAVRSSAGRHAFPIRGCKVSYGHSHHDYPATDMFAAKGCAVVAPVTGRVDEASTVDRWNSSTNNGADRGGLSFSIVGDDGVRYYGSHLSAIRVRAGQRVTAGQVIGAVGNTGDARGIATHLHFGLSWPTRHGIWWVRRGEVYPWSYLDSWKTGGNASPAAAVAREHRRQGDVPPCRIDC